MPTLYGRNTTVQVSLADLGKVITQNPRPKQCPETTNSIGKIELEFINASRNATLAEQSLLGEDEKHLRFLGRHEDMPFFMVRVGKDFFNPNAAERKTRRAARTVRQQTTDKVSVYDATIDETGDGSYMLLFYTGGWLCS